MGAGARPRTPARSRIATSAAALAAAALSLGAQCEGDPSVSCEVDLPSSIMGPAQWMEVGVIAGSCPGAGQLSGGLPATGLVTRIAFEKGNTSPPAIGTLKKGSYAFVAAARSADCGVLATGCTQVDLTNARDVAISLSATAPSLGACTAGAACFDARCVPGLASVDAGQGARCAMSLVGAGPLGDPFVSPEEASAPAVAATGAGFLVAYREYDPTGGQAQLTVASIDAAGVLAIPTPTSLPAQCAGQTETDGVGLGFSGAAGAVVSARPSCGGSQPAGFDVLQVDATGAVNGKGFSPAPGGGPAGLSNAHAVSLTSAGAGWLAFVGRGESQDVAISGQQLQGTPAPFGGVTAATLAQVAIDSSAAALLAGGTAAGAGGSGITLSLGASAATVGPPVALRGTWGSVTVAGARAFVLSDSNAMAQPLAWTTLDLTDGGAGAPSSGTFAPPASGTVLGGDVAVLGDLAFFAVEQAAQISVDIFQGASTTPALLGATSLGSDPRIPSLVDVRDGKLAVAASNGEVLVAWITGSQLGPNDTVGGWALYACVP